MKRLLGILVFILLVASPANAAFLDNCEAHFKLNTGALTTDSCGSNTLINNNTVTEETGILDVAGQFTAATTEFLSIADNASMSTGDIDFTIAVWVYQDSTGTSRAIASKGGTNQYEWHIDIDSSNKPLFQIYTPAGGNRGTATWGSALSATTWYFIVAWHDATANTVNIQVDNGIPVSAAATGPTDGTGAFHIGNLVDVGRYMDGRIDSVSFFKRVLTSQEKTDLWNCTNALDHDFSGGTCLPYSIGVVTQ